MPEFEAVIYNEKVREAVRNDERTELSDDWADQHFITVDAHDADHARRKLQDKYPGHKGFVIVEIAQVG